MHYNQRWSIKSTTNEPQTSWIRNCPRILDVTDREINAIEVRLSELSRTFAGLTTRWQRKPLKNRWQALERPERMPPAASRQIFISWNFTCTSLTYQCVHVKFFRHENPQQKERSGRIKTGSSFSSLALMSCAWAHMSVSFFGFKLSLSFGFYLCLVSNGFLTFFVRAARRLWRFWWPSSWRFTLMNQGKKIVFECLIIFFAWSSAQGGLNIVQIGSIETF